MPEPLAAAPSFDAAKFVDDHNRNASLVQSLEASPSVNDTGRHFGSASGRMAMVRPRDFRLTLRAPSRGDLVDIGSNLNEFWIWSKSDEESTYVGRYEAGGQLPPEMAFQPEWVTEALGLRVIPPEEAKSIAVERGDSASNVVLVHRRTGPGGEATLKRTTVDRASGQILAHQFYGPDGKTVLARATVSDYQPVVLGSGESVILPNRIRLVAAGAGEGEEIQDFQITLGVSNVRLNSFKESSRATVFAVPEYGNRQIVDVNERIQAARSAAGTQARQGGQVASYESMPAPPAGRGAATTQGGQSASPAAVRLERPQPIGRVNSTASLASDPSPLDADLPAGVAEPIAGGIDALVMPATPRPPGAANDVVMPRASTTRRRFAFDH
jgi:hypothetical protein